MPDYDAGFKIVARTAGRELAMLAGIRCDKWEPVVGEVQAATRFADRAFVASRNGQRFVVYMEAFTRWQASAPWSILAKSGLLSERERLPTVSLVYVLLRRGYRPQGGRFRLSVNRKPTQQVWFREVCLWRVRPKPMWHQWPGVLPLFPLCAHGQPAQNAVVVPAAAIGEEVRDPVERADLLTTLAVFGKLAYPQLDVLHLIGRERMRESKFFEEVAEEVASETRREDIRRIATARFGPEGSADLEEKLLKISESKPLADLIELAAKCRNVTELYQELDARIAASEKRGGTKKKKVRTS
jgi:hypothetical protein